MIELRSESVDDTRRIAAVLAALTRPGDLIVLAGQMGSGKTAFAQGFARALGVLEPVTSPTYTLVRSYPARDPSELAGAVMPGSCEPSTNTITLHHADLYRLEHTAEVADLALDELLDEGSVVLVEWGDVVELDPRLQVELRTPDSDEASTESRDIMITTSDRSWERRWDRLAKDLERWAA